MINPESLVRLLQKEEEIRNAKEAAMRPHELGYYADSRAAAGKSIKDANIAPPGPPGYLLGGDVQGSVEVHLYEGESIVDRRGNVVATVIHGELVWLNERDGDAQASGG